MNKVWKKLITAGLIAIAIVYAAALVKIVLLKAPPDAGLRHIQYIPFAFVGDIIKPMASLAISLKNVLGNFLIFIPLGIILPSLFKKLTFFKTVLIGFLVSLAFELLQLITGMGMTDVDDLILNTLGTLAGAGLYFGLFNRGDKELRARLVSFIFLAVFGCLSVLALWVLWPNTLPVNTPVEYVNEEALGSVGRDSFTFSDRCERIEGNDIHLRAYAENPDIKGSYPLADNAAIILERISAVYTPTGNVQRTIVTYENSDCAAAAEILAAQGGVFADAWLNAAGECEMLVLTVHDN